MNTPALRSYFRTLSSLKACTRARLARLGAILACFTGMITAAPVLALVGPARLAPEFVPYVVMVLDTGSGDEASYCSASVITSDIVLTAAHCVSDPSHTRVFYRGRDELVLFDVRSIAIHPGYTPNLGQEDLASVDLALLRLSKPLPTLFKPVELTNSFRVKVGQQLRIVGFGIADEAERGTPGLLRTGILSVRGPESPIFVKLIDPNGTGLGGCTGDSGAPIFAVDQLTLVAVAIRAKGNNGYSCGAVTEAVLIGPQLPWLRKSLETWSKMENQSIKVWVIGLLLAAALVAVLQRSMNRSRAVPQAKDE